MARTIGFSEVNVAANNFTAAQADVANSRYNPVERTSRVSFYCAQSAAGGFQVSFSLGADSHAENVEPPVSANAAVSTRDHLIGQGIALAGQKITVSHREIAGVATGDIGGLLIIEPL